MRFVAVVVIALILGACSIIFIVGDKNDVTQHNEKSTKIDSIDIELLNRNREIIKYK